MKQTSFPGNELREQREKLGLSLYEVFRRTRIPIGYLSALERGELHALPVACYVLGFVRTYCQFLGLKPEPYLDCFRACSRPGAAGFLRRERDGNGFRFPTWAQESLTWAVVLAIMLLGWLTYSVVFQPQADTPDKRVQAGTVELMPPPVLEKESGF